MNATRSQSPKTPAQANLRFPRNSHNILWLTFESLQPRLEGQPQNIVTIAWKAQVRLCGRFRRLRARGVHHNKVTAAIARELCGLIWDIGRRFPVSGAGWESRN